MPLATETVGVGPDLVFIHGWGLNRSVWYALIPALQHHFRMTLVDLPGHGRSALLNEFSLENIAVALHQQLPTPSAMVGWSLGGLVALEMAQQYPDDISQLILVATNVCFVKQPTWPYGIDDGILQRFAMDLETDYERTLQRFLTLQTRGSRVVAKSTIRQLKQCIIAHGLPQQLALRRGLDILRYTNKSTHLTAIKQATLIIQGQQDALVAPQAAQCMAQGMRQAETWLIDGAAHAPFLSHPDIFVPRLLQFLNQ